LNIKRERESTKIQKRRTTTAQHQLNTRTMNILYKLKTTLLGNRKFSFPVELKDHTKEASYEEIALAIYSNSKPIGCLM
jgi:hypothetical protein